MPDTAQPESLNPKSMGKWEAIERVSKTLSIAAIPIVLAVGGWVLQERLQDQAVSRDYVQLAVTILKEPNSTKDMKSWAVLLLNDHSSTKFTPEMSKSLSEGTTQLPASFAIAPANNVPAISSSSAPTEDAENWELKGFGFLFDRDVDSAWQAFKNAETAYPAFHSVAEIRKLLDAKKDELKAAPKEGRNDVWKNFYIGLRKYTWHVSPDVLRKLEEVITNS
jgi:hypothetical protein